MKSCDYLTKIRALARELGYEELEPTRRNHVRFRSPSGQTVVCPSSSGWRTELNFRSRLHRGAQVQSGSAAK